MPSLTTARGGSPVRSSPMKKTRPRSGRRYPVMMFRNVVFPDPLAPTIPTSSPGRISTFTAFAAVTAPNDLHRSRVARIGSGIRDLAAPPPEPRDQRLVDRPQPTGAKQDDGEHDDAERHLPFVRKVLRRVRADELEGDGPHERSQHARIAAQEGDEDEVARLDPEGVLGDDVTDDERRQHASERAERTGEDIGDVHDAPDRLARVLDADLVVGDGLEVEAHR